MKAQNFSVRVLGAQHLDLKKIHYFPLRNYKNRYGSELSNLVLREYELQKLGQFRKIEI